jgi:hypothetical protein
MYLEYIFIKEMGFMKGIMNNKNSHEFFTPNPGMKISTFGS